MHICDWINFDTELPNLKIEKILPHSFFLFLHPHDQLQYAKLWVKCPPSKKPMWRGERYGHDNCIAYVADFREHPVSHGWNV